VSALDAAELLRLNLLSPVVLGFTLGLVAVLVRSDLKLPEPLYTGLAVYLLLAIGLKGGAELAETPVALVWRAGLATLLLGALIPVPVYAVLRRLGGFGVADAAAIAAHYGSVSVVTFTAALAFMQALGIPHEGFLPALVAIMEIPGIVVALVIARSRMADNGWREAVGEILAGRSVVLLVGGLAIGVLAGRAGVEQVAPFFVAPFYGVLVLFLLEMGMVTARRLRDLRTVGRFLVGFALVGPLVLGAGGVLVGTAVGLSLGGSAVFGTMAASASYIAAPAAVRLALPTANPSYYLSVTLGVTFPFNLAFGIPLYYLFARSVHGTSP
jgi:uncharacterized protein